MSVQDYFDLANLYNSRNIMDVKRCVNAHEDVFKNVSANVGSSTGMRTFHFHYIYLDGFLKSQIFAPVIWRCTSWRDRTQIWGLQTKSLLRCTSVTFKGLLKRTLLSRYKTLPIPCNLMDQKKQNCIFSKWSVFSPCIVQTIHVVKVLHK